MAVRTPSLLTAVRFDATKSNGVSPPPPSSPKTPFPHLSLTKPSWIVRTESNVQKQQIKKPNPACVVCNGSGKVNCHHCRGRGRTNCVHLAMLPKGEWPKWCKTCGGSGLGYCSRCLGTGEYRYIMGFHFMKMNNNLTQDEKSYQGRGNAGPAQTQSAADLLLSGEQLNSKPET